MFLPQHWALYLILLQNNLVSRFTEKKGKNEQSVIFDKKYGSQLCLVSYVMFSASSYKNMKKFYTLIGVQFIYIARLGSTEITQAEENRAHFFFLCEANSRIWKNGQKRKFLGVFFGNGNKGWNGKKKKSLNKQTVRWEQSVYHHARFSWWTGQGKLSGSRLCRRLK